MPQKTGLLPKWLLLSTAARFAWAFFDYRLAQPPPWIDRRVFVGLSLLFACIRLLGSTRLKTVFYVLVAASYVSEILLFVAAGCSRCFSAPRVAFEVGAAIFSLCWMVFLYPFYLLRPDEERKSE